jgi:hypothetical protein
LRRGNPHDRAHVSADCRVASRSSQRQQQVTGAPPVKMSTAAMIVGKTPSSACQSSKITIGMQVFQPPAKNPNTADLRRSATTRFRRPISFRLVIDNRQNSHHPPIHRQPDRMDQPTIPLAVPRSSWSRASVGRSPGSTVYETRRSGVRSPSIRRLAEPQLESREKPRSAGIESRVKIMSHQRPEGLTCMSVGFSPGYQPPVL